MSLNMFWFLPTHGDGRYLGTEEGARPVGISTPVKPSRSAVCAICCR